LIETFLVEVLKFSIDEVNEEAHRLEHVVSDRFTDALEAALGHPHADPHGHPIPDREGKVDVTSYQTLIDTAPLSSVVVQQVSDRDKDQLSYLRGLGIVPGACITVVDVAPFGGPLSLSIHDKTVVISQVMARKIGVTPTGEVDGKDDKKPK
jgi:DtxR family Mn-dependent transcriptional regulator